LDYGGLVSSLHPARDPALIGAVILTALGDRYAVESQDSALLEFEQSGAHFLFDLASSAGLPQEDRTVAAWALTPRVVHSRDKAYQRVFPMAPGADDAAVDRGHLIPHLSGGEFGPNIFRQDRALNRGWSEQGKRYRALEREAAARPGTLYFGHLLYVDDSADPSQIEVGVLRGTTLHVERFANRPGSP
jgi:pimeloyl-ACP methyl ester carboxylesterase